MSDISITFHKRKEPHEKDTIVIARGEVCHIIRAWNQGIIPHEMVHYAVEALWPLRGFLRLTAAGPTPEELTDLSLVGAEAVQAEALTNAWQYELLGIVPATNELFISNLASSMAKHNLMPPVITEEEIGQGRELLRELSQRWNELMPGQALVFSLSS